MEGEGEADFIILDNNDKVGKHCLSFMGNRNGLTIRFKFYNKFI